MSDRGDIRHRLLTMRRRLLDTIAASPEIEIAWLSAIAGLNATLAALDEDERQGTVASDPDPRPRRRGGDHQADQRRELHEGIRGIASLLGFGNGKRASDVAREIIDRCSRYQPIALETDPLRREMARVRNAGVPVPTSERHLARIISGESDIQ